MNNDNSQISKFNSSRLKASVLMLLVVIFWGSEYVPAKHALELLDPLVLIFLQYLIGLMCLIFIKIKADGKLFFYLQDIGPVFVCAVFGEVTYM